MNVSQHTPDQWIIVEYKNFSQLMIYHTDGDLRSQIATLYGSALCREHGSIEANARLIALAPTAPHECDIPGCPGAENKHKLDVYPELLKACKTLWQLVEDGILVRDIAHDDEDGWVSRQLDLVMKLKRIEAAIAQSEGR